MAKKFIKESFDLYDEKSEKGISVVEDPDRIVDIKAHMTQKTLDMFTGVFELLESKSELGKLINKTLVSFIESGQLTFQDVLSLFKANESSTNTLADSILKMFQPTNNSDNKLLNSLLNKNKDEDRLEEITGKLDQKSLDDLEFIRQQIEENK